MCPAPNDCSGDHNQSSFTSTHGGCTDRNNHTLSQCKNYFPWKKSYQFAAASFLQRLKKKGLADRFPEEFRMGSNSFASSYGYLPHSQFFLMQRNSIDHTKDLFRFVAYVIHAIFGKDIRETLLTMDEGGIQQILPFANQAMIEARSQAQSELMKALHDDPNHVFNSTTYCENFITKRNDPNGSWKDCSEAMRRHWDDPNHVFNSVKYRKALSEALTGRSWTLTSPWRPPPGVDDMQSCRFCAERYHKRRIERHEKGCQKNPNNVSHTSYHSFENPEYFGAPKTVYQGEYFNACIIGDGTKLCCNCVKQKGLCRQHQHLGP